MKSAWERPPAFFDSDPETSEYMRYLHEKILGVGIGATGNLDAHNIAIEDTGARTRSGKSPLLVADPTTGKITSTAAGLPIGDIDVDGDGLLLGSGGAGGVATMEQASPLIGHRQTADYVAHEHYPATDIVIDPDTELPTQGWYNPFLVDPVADAENVAKGEVLKTQTWSAKQIIDYVAGPTAPAEIDGTGDVSSDAGAPAQKLTINAKAVTRAKQADLGSTKRLIGSTQADATAAEITLGSGLDISAGALVVTSGSGGVGDVVGPASSTDGAVALFDTTTGKLLKVAGDGTMTGDLYLNVAGKRLRLNDGTAYDTSILSSGSGDLVLRNQYGGGSGSYITYLAGEWYPSGNASISHGKAALGWNGVYVGSGSYTAALKAQAMAGNIDLTLPATAGTLAKLTDIPAQVYPGSGIPLSTGSAWGTSITDSAGLRGALSDENGTGAALFNNATSPAFLTSITTPRVDMAAGEKVNWDAGAGAYYITRVAANNNIRIARAEGGGFVGSVDVTQAAFVPTSGVAMSSGAAGNGWSSLYLDEAGAGTETVQIVAPTLSGNAVVTTPNATSTLATLALAETLTNKTIAGATITGDLLPTDTMFNNGDGTHLWNQVYSIKVVTPNVDLMSEDGVLFKENASTPPTAPTSGAEAQLYMKADKLIIRYNDGGTVRYKYLDLTGTGVTWVHTTSAP